MLTKAERKELQKLLKKVNVSEICRELGVNRLGIWRTLNRTGRKYDDLAKVIEKAKEITSQPKRVLNEHR